MVFTAIHPFVVILVVARAIGTKANTLERSIITNSKGGKDHNGSMGTELSDYSISLS